MRDIALTILILGALPFVLKRPWIGVIMWTWVSLMTPHRLTWGFAYNMPFAQLIAIATFIGIVLSRDPKRLPLTPITMVLFLFVVWINVSMMVALEPDLAYIMWDKVMKIQFMVFVTLALLHTDKQVRVFMLVVTLSVGFFGLKGGIFTILGGGEQRVYGPPGSFIQENNSLALATVMTIPLLRYLQMQVTNRWLKLALLGTMILCGFSALGSQSRGALLAIGAMLAFLWLKGSKKIITGALLLALIPLAIGFMPDKWESRMRTIETYEEDGSAMGRLNAWQMAYNVAKDRPLTGGGFEIYTQRIFARYAPNPTDVHAAHSIYFQVLGEQGFVGLALFILLWLLVWQRCGWLVRRARLRPEWKWMGDLASMIQVSLVGYAVGGTFLNLAYYDLPYDLLIAVVLCSRMIEEALKAQDRGASDSGWGNPRNRTVSPAPAPAARSSGLPVPAARLGPHGRT